MIGQENSRDSCSPRSEALFGGSIILNTFTDNLHYLFTHLIDHATRHPRALSVAREVSSSTLNSIRFRTSNPIQLTQLLPHRLRPRTMSLAQTRLQEERYAWSHPPTTLPPHPPQTNEIKRPTNTHPIQQQSLAQRPPLRLRRATDENAARRSRPQEMGLRDPGERQHDLERGIV